MIMLPTHAPHEDGIPFGELDAENRATCTTVRTWGEDWKGRLVAIDKPGCGAVFSLCYHGIRGHCGQVERPAIAERKAA
jgi:hypothetical protein